jgi:hypothetical protein
MTTDIENIKEALSKIARIRWSRTGATVCIPETEDFAGKALSITGLDKRYGRALAAYIAVVNPVAISDLLADAERYRYLAGYCKNTSEHWGGRWSIIVNGPVPTKDDEEDAFDAAIDAAREKQKKWNIEKDALVRWARLSEEIGEEK